MERTTDIDRILRALIVVSRRGVADVRAVDTALGATEQSILAYIATRPGTRSADIARAFRLNRSTISRQLARLISLDLVTDRPEAPGRGAALHLTPRGEDEYRTGISLLTGIVSQQLGDWRDEEISRFAHDLERFVAGPPPAATPPHASTRREPS